MVPEGSIYLSQLAKIKTNTNAEDIATGFYILQNTAKVKVMLAFHKNLGYKCNSKWLRNVASKINRDIELSFCGYKATPEGISLLSFCLGKNV